MSPLFDHDMVAASEAQDLDAMSTVAMASGSTTRELAAENRLLKNLLAERAVELSDVWQQLEDLMHENLLLIDEAERRTAILVADSETTRFDPALLEVALADARRARWARAIA